MKQTQTQTQTQTEKNIEYHRAHDSQRIRFVVSTTNINGVERKILQPTTWRDRARVLPLDEPFKGVIS